MVLQKNRKNHGKTGMPKFDFTMFPFFQSISVGNRALKRVSIVLTASRKTAKKLAVGRKIDKLYF